MAHTPGPWSLGDRHQMSHDPNGEQWGYTVTAVGGTMLEQVLGATFHVAHVGANPGDAECEANAHLIAAAPTMLSTLIGVRAALADLDSGWREMDATDVDQMIAGWLHVVDRAVAQAEGITMEVDDGKERSLD